MNYLIKRSFVAAVLSVMLAGAFTACGSKNTTDDTTSIDADESGKEGQQEAAGTDASPQEGSIENGALNPAEEDGPKYLSDYRANDYVALGEYKGVEINADEFLQQWIDSALAANAETVEVTGRSVELGDTANIDYEGKMDGVAFEGGTAKGTDLVIGSGMFIEGFEEGVIGMEIGETKDIHLKFPDPYKGNPDLSGEPVVFTVTVNSITAKKLPELTDEYVAGLGSEDYSTVEEYKSYMYDLMLTQDTFNTQRANAAIEAAKENAVFQDMPEGMLNRMYDNLLNTAAVYAYMNGMDVGQYTSYVYGGSADDYEAVLMDQANMMAQHYILMGAIAEQEGIEVTDEELEESISAEASGYASYGYESEEAYKAAIDKEAYREFLLVEKTVGFLGESTVLRGECQ